jgi:hypothetical protein
LSSAKIKQVKGDRWGLGLRVVGRISSLEVEGERGGGREEDVERAGKRVREEGETLICKSKHGSGVQSQSTESTNIKTES